MTTETGAGMNRRGLLSLLALSGVGAFLPRAAWAEMMTCPTTERRLAPETFGARGDGVTDDTEAFRKMLACGESRVYSPDPSRVYAVSGTLDLGAKSWWVEDLSLLVIARDSGQHEPLLYVEGEHRFRRILLATALGTAWRGMIRNDVYGGPKPGPRHFAAERIEMRPDRQIAGYSGDAASAITLAHLDTVVIPEGVHCRRIDRVVYLNQCREVEIGPCRMTEFYRGMQIDLPDRLWLEGGHFIGNSPNTALQPGHNALVLRGGRNLSVGQLIIEDTGEHAVRLTGSRESDDALTVAQFGEMTIYRPGACGFKASSGRTDPNALYSAIEDLVIGNLYVEDAGYGYEGLPKSEYGVPNNHFGLFLDNVRGASVSAQLRQRRGQYNGRHAVKLRSVTRGAFDLQAEGSFSSLVEVQTLEETPDMELMRIALQGRRWGLGGEGAAINFNRFGKSRSLRDVAIQAWISEGVDGIDLSGIQAPILGSLSISGAASRLSGRAYIPPPGGAAARAIQNLMTVSGDLATGASRK